MKLEGKRTSKQNKNNINEIRTKLPNFEIVHPFLFPRLKSSLKQVLRSSSRVKGYLLFENVPEYSYKMFQTGSQSL